MDESAHYEFICKQAGIKVAYCAEQFDNDGSLVSHIMKNIKRVMAAEFSRELSAKVYAGQSRLVRLGFKMGGPVGYGLQRLLVDEKSRPKTILKPGEWKSLISEHVKVLPGTPDETAIVRWIFEEFARVKSEEKIVRKLNRRNVPTENGRPWNRTKVARLLQNETFIGNLVYNRHTKKLGTKMVNNPPTLWIRTEGCVEPSIDRDLFFRVREIRKGRRFELPEEEMLVRLRKLWMKKGRLTARIIDDAAGLPCNDCYYRHFGSLRNAYRLIGYTDMRHWGALEAYNRWLALNANNAAELRDRFEKNGVKADVDVPTACVRVNSELTISFAVARWQRPTRKNTEPEWLLRCKIGAPPGWIVALRLREDNRTVLDHILLRSSFMKGTWLRFMDKTRERRKIESYETFEELARSLVCRLKRGASIRSSGTGAPRAMKRRQT
ncbi:recombinase family protein [Bradyrhizobium sp. CSA112]|uniref:recombinase family protein n=1 Tax=Bradyrhizobium sp. CSA112 TaxID=2699170 RepID=UPI0023AF8BBE|nr:recombinase family protein [Bradyrhizobium sp. CSA112]